MEITYHWAGSYLIYDLKLSDTTELINYISAYTLILILGQQHILI